MTGKGDVGSGDGEELKCCVQYRRVFGYFRALSHSLMYGTFLAEMRILDFIETLPL